MTVLANRKSYFSDVAIAAAAKGADLALRIPVVRDYFLDMLLSRLGESFAKTELDRDRLAHCQWLGSHLTAFLHRLINERPNAARAMVRFISTLIADTYRRSDSQIAGTVAPCTVVIEPTDRCNLLCPGCYAKSSCDGSDLPFEQMDQIVQQVIDMGVTLITISGGEPFLREKADQTLTRLAQKYPERGFLVYTNGTMIDEEIGRRLARCGNIFPAISVEGFEHQTDKRRGEGTYKHIRQVRTMLGDLGVMTGFSATMTRENSQAICTDEFIQLRMAEGDMFGWFFLLQPIGRSPRPDLMVTADQRALLRDTIHRWRSEDRPIFLGDFWNDAHFTDGCIAGGKYYFHIYANGDISPCVFAPVACGNIFDIIAGKSPFKSLRDFVQNNPVFQVYRDEKSKVKDRSRPCMMIDHPDAFRRIAATQGCRPAKNMADGYLDGEIAKTIDQTAAQWKEKTAKLPPI
jgi:MoaA/NifB/PqqE/SkfB family radical SAM enzyme